MDCNKSDCIHYKVCEEWKSLGNDNYINESNGNCDCYSAPYNPTGDLISREELKKAIQECEEEPNYQHDGETWQNGLYMAETLVDNAQAVDLWKLRQEATENALKKAEVLYGRPKDELICPNCDLYEQAEDDYCQYAGECTINCRKCKYFKQKDGAE